MSSNLSLTKENHDLSQLVAGTVSCIGNIMASLHELQGATIAMEGEDVQFTACNRLREDLRKNWESLISVLKEARKFADDIRFLATSTASSTEVAQYLHDLKDQCKRIRDGFESLMRHRDLPCPYDQYWAVSPEVEDREQGFFYEHGHRAKKSFHLSRLTFHRHLGQILILWTYLLEWISPSSLSFDVETLKALDDEWTRHRESLMKAIVTITHHCDGVMINSRGLSAPAQASSPPSVEKESHNASQLLPVAGFIIGCVGIYMAGQKPGPLFHSLDPSTTVHWVPRPSPTAMAPGPSPAL